MFLLAMGMFERKEERKKREGGREGEKEGGTKNSY